MSVAIAEATILTLMDSIKYFLEKVFHCPSVTSFFIAKWTDVPYNFPNIEIYARMSEKLPKVSTPTALGTKTRTNIPPMMANIFAHSAQIVSLVTLFL